MPEKVYDSVPMPPTSDGIEAPPSDVKVGDTAKTFPLQEMVPPPPAPKKRAPMPKSQHKRTTSLIDMDLIPDATLNDLGDQERFDYYFDLASDREREFIKAALRCTYVKDIPLSLPPKMRMTKHQMQQYADESHVGNALYQGMLLRLETKRAKQTLVQALFSETSRRRQRMEDVATLLMTDKEHLQEMAAGLNVSGDGKRAILKEIIAYGMQARKIEDAHVNEHGQIVVPAVFSLADPKLAQSAVQELNRMDNEYGNEDRATSSVESQAERVARLREMESKLNTNHKNQMKSLERSVKTVAKQELRDEDQQQEKQDERSGV